MQNLAQQRLAIAETFSTFAAGIKVCKLTDDCAGEAPSNESFNGAIINAVHAVGGGLLPPIYEGKKLKKAGTIGHPSPLTTRRIICVLLAWLISAHCARPPPRDNHAPQCDKRHNNFTHIKLLIKSETTSNENTI